MVWHNCPECDKQFNHVSNLYRHLKRIHNIMNYAAIANGADGLKFAEIEQFKAWKRKIEDEDGAFFVVSSSKKLQFGRKSYYVCNRSGAPRMIPDSRRKRHSKYIGTSKINANCPARFTARFTSQGIVVKDFHRGHSGHKLDPVHLPIPAKVKQRIANELAAKVPFDYILDKTLSEEPTGNVSRTKLLRPQDIRNIAVQFGIEMEGKMHPDDETSVKAWVLKERNKEGESAVLLYKPFGEKSLDLGEDDFFLAVMTSEQEEILKKFGDKVVALDSTRGTNAYRFEITTLLVSDEYGQGFPCAFLFSNKTDEHFVELFLKAVREKAGIVDPEAFMSVEGDLFYNAWLSAMGVSKCETRLLCTWQVLRDWRNNLSSVRDAKRRNEAWRHLRLLLINTDEEAFHEMLPLVLEWLFADSQTTKFGRYFNEKYAVNYAMWSYAFRRGVNMHIERFHRGLKRHRLTARVPKRLDLTIHNLLRLTRRRFADRARFGSAAELKCPQSRHDDSAALSPDDVFPTSDNVWAVFSSDSVNAYEVKLERTACACSSVCVPCNTCCHMYSCTCHDYAISSNMCKHVHLVCRSLAGDQSGAASDRIETATDHIETTSDHIETADPNADFLLVDSESSLVEMELRLADKWSRIADAESRIAVGKSRIATEKSLIDDTGSPLAESTLADRCGNFIEKKKVALCELAESIIGKCSTKRELHLVEQCLKRLDFNLDAEIDSSNAI
ncbi:Zinc finger protein [Nesidiocoris tenuis]|uniref:Zinc finger protein n=1 Tax=Nesidiocoris tenuis TaxID=355587 RepID=A0ABN7BCU1_9HEMI|nr:Zinc finger protein [Nesidiocoris tenuis]